MKEVFWNNGTFIQGMREDLGDAATDEEKEKAAKALYKWVEQGNLAQIRSGVNGAIYPTRVLPYLSR